MKAEERGMRKEERARALLNRHGFEDLNTWKKARHLTGIIYALTREKEFQKDWALQMQIRRAAISVMANIAEGFERNTRKEHIQFLYIAKGSAGELRSHLYIARDMGYLTEEKFETIHENLVHLSRMLSKHIEYLQDKSRKNE